VYDAYGQIVSMTGDATLQKLNPCTYRGYYYDAETGLYYLQSRYYNPEWGRFINADSNFDINTGVLNANIFIYCANNPVIYADANGESVTLVVLGVTLVLSNAQAIALAFMSAIGAIALFWRLFPRQYRNFINGIGGLLGTLGSAISQVFQLIRTKAIAIGNSLSNTVSKAKTKIRNESKRFEYWIAIKLNLGRGATYFPSKGISYSYAISFVRKGGDVFAKNASKAKQLARAVGNGRAPTRAEIHSKNGSTLGYWWHYHDGRRTGGHIFYV